MQNNFYKKENKGISNIDLNIMGKIPPQSVDVEKVVLGTIILESFVLPEVILLLSPDFFYLDNHKKIYEAIIQLYSKSKAVDLLTLTEQLKVNGHLEDIGGVHTLTELTMNVGQNSNIESHIRIITEKFISRELITLSMRTMQDGYDDTIDVFKTHENTENALSKINQYIIGKDYEGDISQDIEKTYKLITDPRDKRITGVSTGLGELDEFTGGWNQGNMIILCGRPGMGKTTRALNFILHAVKNGNKTSFFSAEMNKNEINKKIISNISKISGRTMKEQTWTPEQGDKMEEAKNTIKTLPLYVNDKCGITPNYIKTVCRERKRKYGLDLIVIDYLQLLMANETFKGQSEEMRVASISLAIKTLAKDLNVPIIILSQLSRECESRPNKRPLQSDLRYSGSLEQDSDLILSVYRPKIYYRKEKDPDYKMQQIEEYTYNKISELGILKNRTGESGVHIVEYFDGARSNYYEKIIDLNTDQLPGDNILPF